MKTTFIPTRGQRYHVIHETKTGAARTHAWTICGREFNAGERSTRQPTCPDCVVLDNPLTLTSDMITYLTNIVEFSTKRWKDAPRNTAYHLIELDFITPAIHLTRRGNVLVEDFERGAVPMQDASGVFHTREPLGMYPRCQKNGRLEHVDAMTVSRYEKLRKLEGDVMVTCLECLSK